ncbi:MAG: M48 family metallopeptidase [Betaproteobacteria bacterium]|nr:M48 family metallopeptidase [Betaproteobacteria bacterium]
MNFFEHQELARRNTRVLVLLYALAVGAVVAAVTAVLAAAYLYSHAAEAPGPMSLADVPPALLWGGALGTLALILAVTVVQSLRLGGGGEVVARMAGAQPVSPETRDPLERRLLNVVEEMAIAAGVRVPKVFVMAGEHGINAFAAGTDVSNAVVAVTRGTLETLNRDELQGVVGHEFSHMLHGDMRINIRMIGVLAGIVFIGSIGRFAMQAMGRGGGGRKNGAAAVFAVGLALFVIGYTGLFFARLIKAAIARQREFLADASSVQYTRNPDGIAGALDQIRASARGTLIEGRSAEELSHMYFGESVKLWFSGIFATHPPVDERIRRVHPGFEPSQYRARRAAAALPPDADEARRRKAAEGLLATVVLAASGKRTADAEHAWGRSPQASAQLVGTLDADKVDKAQRLLASLPEDLRAAVHQSAGARAAVLALVAPQAGAARLDPALHLPLVDLALPALKEMDEAARSDFLRAVESAIRADRRVSLHEFVLLTLLRHQLAPSPPIAAVKRIEALRDESLALLSLIAHVGHADTAAAFNAGIAELGLHEAALLPRQAITPEAAGAALDRLRGLAPLAKALLVKAMFAVAAFDGTIRLGEAELLRVTGAVLDCPLPPLVT